LEVSLNRGSWGELFFEVPERNLHYVVDRVKAPALEDLEDEIRRGLESPIGSPPLREMVDAGSRVLLVCDDITRPTPQRLILPTLLDEFNKVGVRDEDMKVIIALGTHRDMNEKEILERFGREVVDRVPVINHDYRNPDNLVNLGRTESGIPIIVNREVVEADFVVTVGNIVPHCYAGWGGGGKMIQPGVCGEETTAATHVMAGKIRPLTVISGNLDNPVRKAIDDVAIKAGLKMIVNTVLNEDDEVSGLFIGHPLEAFKEGVKMAEKVYCPKVPGEAEITVVSSYPADIDYWQAHKALILASLGTKAGGTIILVTPCPEGIARQHPIVRERARFKFEENLQAIEEGALEDLIGAGMVLLHNQVMERNRVVCVSEYLSQEDKSDLGFEHAETVEEALSIALKRHGVNSKVGVLRCGEILPKIER